MSSATITFYSNHQPALEDGDYTVEISQKLGIKDNATPAIAPSIQDQTLSFHVSGPRFVLDASLIHSMYPPTGGKGDYRATLPSLVLNRSTLPWERSPVYPEITAVSAPWLFLLVVDETEAKLVTEQNNGAVSGLVQTFSSSATGKPPLSPEELTRLPEKINYLEVDASLSGLFPATLAELQYLAYARVKTNADGTPGEEKAVLVSNRLPQAGHSSTVYLVSLENNYIGTDGTATFKGITNDNYVLPYLYKWPYYAFDEKLYCITQTVAEKLQKIEPSLPDLSSLLDHLYDNTSAFKAALQGIKITEKDNLKVIEAAAELPGSTFHQLLSHLPGGFAAFSTDPVAASITSSGTVKLAYQQLEESVDGSMPKYTSAWYRGPLAASVIDLTKLNPNFPLVAPAVKGQSPEPPQFSKALIINDTASQIEDLSYAAAFELGRLTALDDVDFSTGFFKWKSETAMALRLEDLKKLTGYKNIMHLPLDDKPQVNPLPQHVEDKFTAWKKLEGIPYRYLIPDPKLLPNESIRFFQLDRHWVNAFICGAFSIGHTVAADLSEQLKTLFLTEQEEVTGFLIRSLTVSGWPDFQVNAHPSPRGKDLSLVRKDNLDVDTRLFLLSGAFSQLDFHLHPGHMHPGFLYEDSHYTKQGGSQTVVVNTNNTLTMAALIKVAKTTSVAEFAAWLMEGTPAVRFTID